MAQELWIAKKCKVGIRTVINHIFYDGVAFTKLVFARDQLETFDSQFEVAEVKNMIRNWIDQRWWSLHRVWPVTSCGSRLTGC